MLLFNTVEIVAELFYGNFNTSNVTIQPYQRLKVHYRRCNFNTSNVTIQPIKPLCRFCATVFQYI